MPITIFETNSPVVLVTDFTLESDLNYDRENDTNNSVMRLWGAATKYMSRTEWSRLTKVALFRWGTDFKVDKALPAKERTAKRRAIGQMRDAARAELKAYLAKRKPKLIIVLQTRSKSARKNKDIESAEIEGAEGTVCWSLFNAPGSMSAVFGTIFESPFGPAMAVPNPVNFEFVYEHVIRHWFQSALMYGKVGQEALLECKAKYYKREDIDRGLYRILTSAKRGELISVDLEFVPNTETITVVGFSDGECAVAVPWDTYTFIGESEPTPGRTWQWEEMVKAILYVAKTLTGHNAVGADIPMFEKRGIKVEGRMVDTFILHALVFKQYPAGLQACLAQEFLVRPWKTMFRPTTEFDKEDWEFWVTNPEALRDYNCSDSYYGWHLCKSLAWKAGISNV